MVCSQCGNNMEAHERFCSKCGRDSIPDRAPAAPQASGSNWDVHVKVLGWIFIVTAFFIAIPGTIFFALYGVFNRTMHGPILFGAPMFGLFTMMLLPIPIGIAAAGIGLLKYREWARILTLIFAAFMLMGIPFGTAVGIYAFWVLLSTDGSNSYKAHVTAS
jgi:hypothetical protein